MTPQEYMEYLQEKVREGDALARIAALTHAITLMSNLSIEYEKSGSVAEFKVAERMIAEVFALRESIQAANFRN